MSTPSFQTSVAAPPKITLIESLQEYAKNRASADALAREEALQRDKLTEDKRRWEIQDARLQKQDALAERERNRVALARQASWDLAPTFTINDYDPRVQKDRQILVEAKDRELTPTLDFLRNASTTGDDYRNRLEAAKAAYRDTLKAQGVTAEGDIDDLVRQRGFKLAEYGNKFASAKSPEEIQKLENELTTNMYDARIQQLDERIAKGVGLTAEQQEKALFKNIPDKYRDALSYQELKQALAPHLSTRTAESIKAGEEARIKAIHDAEKDQMEAYDKYYQRANRGFTSHGISSKSKWSDVASALESMSKVDFGWYDNAQAKKGFEHLVSKGIPPSIAASAILYGADEGMLDKDFPSLESDEFAELQLLAETLKGAETADPKTGKTFIDMDKYKYSPQKARSVDDILREELEKGILLNTAVPIDKKTSGRIDALLGQYPIRDLSQSPVFGKGTSTSEAEGTGKTPKTEEPSVNKEEVLIAPSKPPVTYPRTGLSGGKIQGTIFDAIRQLSPPLTSEESKAAAQAEVDRLEAEYNAFKNKPNTMFNNFTRAHLYQQLSSARQKLKSTEPPKASKDTSQQVSQAVTRASKEYNVSPELIKAVIAQESGGNATAVSPSGAQGLMQLMPTTAKELGVTDPFNPVQNIMGGTKYLANLLKQFDGNHELALAAYNAGPTTVLRYGGIPPFPETQAYVKNVLNSYRNLS